MWQRDPSSPGVPTVLAERAWIRAERGRVQNFAGVLGASKLTHEHTCTPLDRLARSHMDR